LVILKIEGWEWLLGTVGTIFIDGVTLEMGIPRLGLYAKQQFTSTYNKCWLRHVVF